MLAKNVQTKKKPAAKTAGYLKHFALAIQPFSSAPDPSLLFLSHNYSNIVASLEFAVRRGFGIVKLVGEDGTGKTALSRLLQGKLTHNDAVVVTLDGRKSSGHVPAALCECFGLQDKTDPFEDLYRYLLSQHHFGRLTVVIIDEAHCLDPQDFNALVRLESMEIEKKKLLQIVLLGHSQLDECLDLPENNALSRCIVFSLSTQLLNEEESRRYLLHRLHLAREPGVEEEQPVFADTALDQLARWGGGKPYTLNLLAEDALRRAGEEKASLVSLSHVMASIRDNSDQLDAQPGRSLWRLPRLSRRMALLAVVVALLVSALALVSSVDLTMGRTDGMSQPEAAVSAIAPAAPPKIETPPASPPPPVVSTVPEPVPVMAPPVIKEAPPLEAGPSKVYPPASSKKAEAGRKPARRSGPVENRPEALPAVPSSIMPDSAAPTPPAPAASLRNTDVIDALRAGSGSYPGTRH